MDILFFLPGLNSTYLGVCSCQLVSQIFQTQNSTNGKLGFKQLLIEKSKKQADKKVVHSVNIESPYEENKSIFEFLHSISLDEIDAIVFCNGPGRFMSLRLCATIANTLARQKGLKLYSIRTNEFFRKLVGDDVELIFQLNKTEVYVDHEGKTCVKKTKELSKGNQVIWFGNMRERGILPDNYVELEGKKVKKYENVLLELLSKDYIVSQIQPFYGK